MKLDTAEHSEAVATAPVLPRHETQPLVVRERAAEVPDGEDDVIETGTPLAAWLAAVRNVVMQSDHPPGRLIGKPNRVAGLLIAEMREAWRNPLQPKHPLIPRRTRLDVGDGG